MPFIRIETSEKINEEAKEELTRRLGEAISIIPGKSERWLMLDFCAERNMAFSGEDGSCAMVTVKLFGSANSKFYNKLTARITEITEDVLSLSPTRTYVQYEEVYHWGYGGENF